jgi:hypothetical protein
LARLSGVEKWLQLLQAHLYLDHIVTLLLNEALLNPEAINLSRMGFSQKLQLLIAMNIIPAELVAVIESVNGLRNKIAHDLNFEIDEKTECDFINAVPVAIRDIAKSISDSEPGRGRFGQILVVLVIRVELLRQMYCFHKLEGTKVSLELRVVAEEIRGEARTRKPDLPGVAKPPQSTD